MVSISTHALFSKWKSDYIFITIIILQLVVSPFILFDSCQSPKISMESSWAIIALTVDVV